MNQLFHQVETFYDEVWNHKHLEKEVIQQFLSTDLSWFHPLGHQEGVDRVCASIMEWIEGFPDCQVYEIRLTKRGRVIFSDWKGKATHQGRIYGIPPTGKQIEVSGKSSFFFHGSKIIHISTSIPMLQIFKQLGFYIKKEDYPEQSCYFKSKFLFTERIRYHYPDLTMREIECLSLILLGLTGKQIANILCISVRTVESHFSAGFMKLGFLKKDSFIEKLFEDKTYMIWHDLGLRVLSRGRTSNAIFNL